MNIIMLTSAEYEEIIIFDKELTNDEKEIIEKEVAKITKTQEDYTFEDIEDKIDEIVPFVRSIRINENDKIYL